MFDPPLRPSRVFSALPLLAGALLAACGGGAQALVKIPPPSPIVLSAQVTPPLPPGVLAEASTNGDVARVEERDGLRRLLLNGVVQGAVPSGGHEVAGVDPLVALVRAARPMARTALVIGLGTGRTATSLAASGFDVEVAELSPVVIDFARRFFGYQGHAAVSDGLDYLERTGKAYDVVIVDASIKKAPPERFLREEALAKLGLRRGSATLFATRFQGFPRALQVAVPRHLENPFALVFSQLFGSGVGDEEQNLYLLASTAPANLVDLHGIAAWPLFEGLPPYARPTATPLLEPSGSRQVTLIGYLVRGSTGDLFIDLPHYEMGAMRYQLSGADAAGLAKLLPQSEIAPTAGDIGPDGDTTKTLRDLLGGGGYKRSEVRFSSVVVAVEGVATLAAVIDPNATGTALRLQHLTAPTDARVPWGGALYELAVTRVLFTYDRAA